MTKTRRSRNEGSISKRPNGSWRAQVSQAGDRISKGFRTRNDALVWIKLTKFKIDQGVLIKGEATTLESFLLNWLQSKQSALRPKTYHQYGSLISHHILPSIGHTKLCQLNIKTIEGYYTRLLKDGVGVRTIRIINNILHSSMNKAVKYGLLLHNPTQGATLPVYCHDEMRILTPNQVGQFLIQAKESRYFALYFLAITTGMRLGELLGLKWTDIDWSAKTVHIQRQKQYIPGQGFILIEPKTKSGKRTIQLGNQTVLALNRHHEAQEKMCLNAGTKWVEMDLVFPSSIGTPSDASNIRIDFNRLLLSAGLPKIRIHDLRHTAASLFLNHKVPVIVVTNILGHSKPSVTLDIYSHVFTDMQVEAANIMDQLIAI